MLSFEMQCCQTGINLSTVWKNLLPPPSGQQITPKRQESSRLHSVTFKKTLPPNVYCYQNTNTHITNYPHHFKIKKSDNSCSFPNNELQNVKIPQNQTVHQEGLDRDDQVVFMTLFNHNVQFCLHIFSPTTESQSKNTRTEKPSVAQLV